MFRVSLFSCLLFIFAMNGCNSNSSEKRIDIYPSFQSGYIDARQIEVLLPESYNVFGATHKLAFSSNYFYMKMKLLSGSIHTWEKSCRFEIFKIYIPQKRSKHLSDNSSDRFN